MNNNIPSWNSIFISLAKNIANRSHDTKYKVGCVITNKDNTKVLAFGYNGDEHKGSNTRDSLESGCSGFIHAEENALIKLNYDEPYKKVYLTHSPCKMCAKKLINAKVNEILYESVYDNSVLEWLSEHPEGKNIILTRIVLSE